MVPWMRANRTNNCRCPQTETARKPTMAVSRRGQTLYSDGPSWEAMQEVRNGEKWSLYECVPTLQQPAPFRTIDVLSNIKIKQYINSLNTNRSQLVRGLESTEAMRAVSSGLCGHMTISNYHWRCATPQILGASLSGSL